MKRIGGNITADFLSLSASRNRLGEMEKEYTSLGTHTGFLDYASGQGTYGNYKARTEDTSHVFVCDRWDVPLRSVSRLVIGGRVFDVLYADEPMELGYHYEIFLREVRQDAR